MKCIRLVAVAGTVAGTLDAIAAIINFLVAGGKQPVRIFLFIASGVFGRDAFAEAPSFAWWGVLFHYGIAFGWTLFYFAIYPKLGILSTNPYVSGLGYGVFVWLAINLVVVPLSNTPPLPFTISRALIGAAILMVCIGLPVALSAHYCYPQKTQTS